MHRGIGNVHRCPNSLRRCSHGVFHGIELYRLQCDHRRRDNLRLVLPTVMPYTKAPRHPSNSSKTTFSGHQTEVRFISTMGRPLFRLPVSMPFPAPPTTSMPIPCSMRHFTFSPRHRVVMRERPREVRLSISRETPVRKNRFTISARMSTPPENKSRNADPISRTNSSIRRKRRSDWHRLLEVLDDGTNSRNLARLRANHCIDRNRQKLRRKIDLSQRP